MSSVCATVPIRSVDTCLSVRYCNSTVDPTWTQVIKSLMPLLPEDDTPLRVGEWVYFAHLPIARRVKIGTSRDPLVRLRRLSCDYAELRGLELVLVGSISGGRAVESLIHHKFAAHRVHGEWFEDAILPDVLDLIALDIEHYG